ncbi:PspA/IM30 family protein [Halomonas organivorans]|uniref:Phage shock protein A n=1 Tax=Halomonas organivorans TaxID=257772 RepID=A0A7W5BUH1_9GAMM|nr:PspA/IM30 family protein [Halomonas organivorans]MBB3139376.1 phage shock protein A [Halomonas organivorans]
MLRKLFTAFRGAASETGEAIIDHQAIRILEQEMRDAEKELNDAKTQLTSIMADRSLAQKKVDTLEESISEYEASAIAALEKGDEALAQEVAERIASLEEEKSSEEAVVAQFDGSIETLQSTIRKSQNNQRQIKQQISVVKATESAQKAQAAVAEKHSGQNASMSNAMDSLDRIKKKQAHRAAQMEAASQMEKEASGADLDERLKKAGIGSSNRQASDVMSRLKARASNTENGS